MEREERYQFCIEDEQAGSRIDQLLASFIADISRSFCQKLLEEGGVTVNGALCPSKKYKVKTGDLIEVIVPQPEELQVCPEDIPLDIVYEDEDVLVVNKPRGMVVHPAAGNYTGTLVNAVMFHCRDRLSSINGVIRPGIVHRIDKDTSGLLMIAKNDRAHECLSAQLAEHSITRRYQALVCSNFKTDSGTVCAPIGRDPKNRLRRAVGGINAKRAVTHYRVEERFGDYTRIEAVLETGRTHQIRVHMAYIRHPLVGDPLYGPKKQALGVEGQLLHAGVLGFVHPSTGEYMEFSCPRPAYFEDILKKLRERKNG